MLRETLRKSFAWTAFILLASGGCASIALSPSQWQLPSFGGAAAEPGTPDWWKKHKSKAEFVPGEGFRVAGAEGFFDQEGRPIKTHVAKVVDHKAAEGLMGEATVKKAMDDIKSQVGLGPDRQRAEQAFADGENLFRREEYAKAAKQFKQAVARGLNSRLEQDAMFMLAESLFFGNHYPEAVESYDKLISQFPNSPHLDKVIRRQFDIARYWEQHQQYKPRWATTPNLFDKTRPLFDTLGRSRKTYENIRLNDPTGPLADDAIMATANSYFLRGRFEDADYHYGLIRREYPRSEHQYDAHLLGLQSKLRMYQGPDYSGVPLEEAKKLVKQLKIQFVGELNSEERKRLAEVEAKLHKQLATREMRMGQYYDEIEYYGSARFYYARVLHQYPDSELAVQARARLIALGDSPDHPEEKLGWFVKLFPQNSERTAIAQVPMIESDSETLIARPPETDAGQADGKTILR